MNELTDQELNEACARRLGWIPWDGAVNKWRRGKEWRKKPRNYVGDIRAAWEVVEFMSRKGVGTYLFGGIGDSWHCDLHRHPAAQDDPEVSQSADTAPRAICLAFLKLQEGQ